MKCDLKTFPIIITGKIVVMMHIKVILILTIHQINGKTARNTWDEEDEDRSSREDTAKAALLGMVSLSSPSLTSFHSKKAFGKRSWTDSYQTCYLISVKIMH